MDKADSHRNCRPSFFNIILTPIQTSVERGLRFFIRGAPEPIRISYLNVMPKDHQLNIPPNHHTKNTRKLCAAFHLFQL
jgi:hypothetical protein